jgi:hypothetical protein
MIFCFFFIIIHKLLLCCNYHNRWICFDLLTKFFCSCTFCKFSDHTKTCLNPHIFFLVCKTNTNFPLFSTLYYKYINRIINKRRTKTIKLWKTLEKYFWQLQIFMVWLFNFMKFRSLNISTPQYFLFHCFVLKIFIKWVPFKQID